MQFDYNYQVGKDFVLIKFKTNITEHLAITSLETSFERIDGNYIPESNEWKFPLCVNPEIITRIIHNTCFVCGGLMKNHEYHNDHILRKCTQCGHSHT